MTEDGARAEGTERFIYDLLLRFTNQQYVLEVLGDDERGYRGFGPKFVEQANRISKILGLERVVERNRGTDAPSPLGRGWPHCVRPASYYGNDVTEHALELARGITLARRQPVAAPTQGILELILYRLAQGRADEAQQMIQRHLDWVQHYRRRRPHRQGERGSEDPDGKAPGEVQFDRRWLDWNNGTVLKIAQIIDRERSFWDLPILADALLDAGCGDDQILRHLSEPMEHSRRCWVLRILLALDPE
jgi:hypothetical protein